MPEIPEEALQAAEAAYACAYTSGVPHEEIARIIVEAADPAIRADERRKTAEEIAAAILADADPLIATRTGASQWEGAFRAARVARQIGEARDAS